MGVDFPDGYKISVIKGWDGTEFKNLRVTTDGELYILVSALSGVTLIPLQADSEGNLFLNVKAQDLAEVINRPKYGAATASQGSKICAVVNTTVLTTISGKGIIYGGNVYLHPDVSHKNDYVQLIADSAPLIAYIFDNQNKYNLTHPAVSSLFLTCFDDTNFIYSNALSPGVTFETSLELRYYNNEIVDTPTVYYELLYAVV